MLTWLLEKMRGFASNFESWGICCRLRIGFLAPSHVRTSRAEERARSSYAIHVHDISKLNVPRLGARLAKG